MSFMPARLIRPKLGLKPTTPQKAAGRMTLPAVWVPKAKGKKKSATPAAEPEEEPPGVWAGLAGLAVGPGLRVANSVVTVLPMTAAPAARAAATAAASARGRQPCQMGEPYSLGISAVSSTSFTPSGRPWSGPGRAVEADVRAAEGSRKAKACTVGSRSAMRAREASISASGRSFPLRMRAAASVAVRREGSCMGG